MLQIVEVEMPFDKTKNQRKGFCFITFESEQVVNELLKTPKQTINGKEVRFIPINKIILEKMLYILMIILIHFNILNRSM